MGRATQWAKILDYCKRNGSITVRDAMQIGINSPTKRISEMREMAEYEVQTEIVSVYDDDGSYRTRYARYYIREAA